MGKKLRVVMLLLLYIYAAKAEDVPACTPFIWVTDFDGSEKAAMVVAGSMGERQVLFQFDTGSDVSGYYGAAMDHSEKQKFAAIADSGYVTASLSIGGIQLGRQTFYQLSPQPRAVSGRIGLTALLGHIVKIDYPVQEICLLTESQYDMLLPDLLLSPMRVRSKKLFLYTELNGRYWPGIFFDTGASLYDLLVDREVWQGLTGRQGTEPDNQYIQGWSRQQKVTTVGAPILEDMSVSGISLNGSAVHFTRERPKHFSDYPVTAVGLVGNAPFFDKTVILDLRERDSWFGVAQSRE